MKTLTLLVFAASSLTQVLPRLAEEWKAQSGAVNGGEMRVEVKFSFESSSRVARQIAEGAPADLLFSADEEWMDFAAAKGVIEAGTRADLASNRVVLVVPGDAKAPPVIPADLAGPAVSRVAVAGESVPVGKFARQALSANGVLESLRPKFVNADNARSALAWVARGEVQAGIVYETDARAEPRVRVAFMFEELAHSPIRYPAAVVRRPGRDAAVAAAARSFLEFCRSPKGRAIWREAGFGEPRYGGAR